MNSKKKDAAASAETPETTPETTDDATCPPEDPQNDNDRPTKAAATEDAPAEAAASQEAEAVDRDDDIEDDPIVRLETEVAELKDQLLRTMAEIENVRRRAAKDRTDASKYAITGFARDMLSVTDNLHRALANVPDALREKDGGLIEGIEMTRRELSAAFERHGIRSIEAKGETFDHNLHQAMFEIETTDHPPGTVIEVMQPGYMIADRLLRPAMVGLAKAPAEAAEPTEDGAAED